MVNCCFNKLDLLKFAQPMPFSNILTNKQWDELAEKRSKDSPSDRAMAS